MCIKKSLFSDIEKFCTSSSLIFSPQVFQILYILLLAPKQKKVIFPKTWKKKQKNFNNSVKQIENQELRSSTPGRVMCPQIFILNTSG